MQGTSQGESANKVVNCMVKDIGQQGAELGHTKMWLRVTIFNSDEALAHVLGIKEPLDLCWYIHEALLTRQAPYPKTKLFHEMQFPGTIPDDYDEPNGLDFL